VGIGCDGYMGEIVGMWVRTEIGLWDQFWREPGAATVAWARLTPVLL
jgi:hypothetical protein